MPLREIKQGNTTFWVAEHNCRCFQANWQSDWFDHHESVSESSWPAGRQAVARFVFNDTSVVLRHYCRGGAPARVSKDRFVFCGHAQSRPYREITLLLKMQQLQLPVPQVIAARLVKHTLTYTADIMMHEINNVQTLAQIIRRRRPAHKQWLNIGATIQRFHKQGIEHVDLNANNILIDADSNVYLIDFDRCAQGNYSQRRALASLARLQRSLQKINRSQAQGFFQQDDFQTLLRAYRS